MAITKKKKKIVIVLAALVGVAGLMFAKNPKTRTWKNASGEVVDLGQYPLQWSFLSNKVTVEGRPDLVATWVGNKLAFTNGNYWTC